MKTLVTGATGFVGRRLLAQLDRPVVLSRDSSRAALALAEHDVTVYDWDPTGEPAPSAAFEGVEAVVHLVGESVGEGRWTKAKRDLIRESRVASTRHLVQTLSALTTRPKVLICASAVGYYGWRGETKLDESAPAGDDFLAEVCAAWEAEADQAAELDVRVVKLRIGMVLGHGGGALKQMLLPFQWGLGAPMGNGRQWTPWVHIDDVVGAILFVSQNSQLSGAINAVAPQSATNRQLTKALGKALGRPTILPPVPGFVLRMMIGQFAEVLLGSSRVVPKILEREGYPFQHPELESALRSIFSQA